MNKIFYFLFYFIFILLSISYADSQKVVVTWEDAEQKWTSLAGFDLRVNGDNTTIINVPDKILFDTISINQQEQSGQWNSIGSYDFTNKAKIIIISNSTSDSTCADAIKFKSSTTEIIIDNGDNETSFMGEWKISGGSNPYGSNSLYSKKVNAKYIYEIDLNGTYEVLIWWTGWPSRSTNVPIEIYNEGIRTWKGNLNLFDDNNTIDMRAKNTYGNKSNWSAPCNYNPLPDSPDLISIRTKYDN